MIQRQVLRTGLEALHLTHITKRKTMCLLDLLYLSEERLESFSSSFLFYVRKPATLFLFHLTASSPESDISIVLFPVHLYYRNVPKRLNTIFVRNSATRCKKCCHILDTFLYADAYEKLLICRNPSSYCLYTTAFASFSAASFPKSFSTIASPNGIAVPMPRLVITFPSTATSSKTTFAPASFSSKPG